MICRPASNVPNGVDAPIVANWLKIAVVPGVSARPNLPFAVLNVPCSLKLIL
jgi:hypothetical protein